MNSSPSSAESNRANIVVIGGGGAALSAAAEAARLRRSVILIEKSSALGGTTALSVGSLMAAGTRLQKRAGISDSPEQHNDDIEKIVTETGMGDNRELRRLLLENAADSADFLESIGVHFAGPLEQPGFAINRFYQALPGGRVYIARLAEHCKKLGVDIRLSTRAVRLLKGDNGVRGVDVEVDGKRMAIAARSIILASGDMSAAKEMRRQLWGPSLDALEPLNANSTGDGQRMGLEAGGRLVARPDLVPHGTPRFALPPRPSLLASLPPWRPLTWAMRAALNYLPARLLRPLLMRAGATALAPVNSLYYQGAILVNARGERFVDETGPIGDAIANQPGGEAFVVFDERVTKHFSAWPNFVSTAPGIAYAYVDDYKRARKDIFRQAPTLAELASLLRCPAENLQNSFTGKNKTSAPPYIALGPLKTWLLLTQVGLAVNTKLQVLDANDEPISGLYAAGGTGQGGLSCTSYHHGHSLAWAFTSGRLAGRNAALELEP